VILITGPRSILLLALSAVLWSVACQHDGRVAEKDPRGARKAPVESEAERLKEIDRIGPTAAKDRAARANLGRGLHDPRRLVRDQAAHWLSKAGAEAVPILITALEDKNTQISVTAAYALGRMGEAAAPAVPDLTRLLGGNMDTLANMSSWALSQVGPRGEGGFIPLLRGLRYGNAYERAAAARQLSLYGDASAVAIPLLARTLEDPDPIAAQAAADALVRIGPRASLAVQAMLTSPKPLARLRAVLVLSQMRTSYF
jgi:HEAT repeat protein